MPTQLKLAFVALAGATIGLVPLATATAADPASGAPTADRTATPMDAQLTASRTAEALAVTLGDAYAGSWLDDDGSLTVATTTTDRASTTARASTTDRASTTTSADGLHAAAESGVRFVDVSRPMSELGTITDGLAGTDVPDTVAAWGPDAPTNSVVVVTSDPDAAAEWVAGSGVDADAVRYQRSSEQPIPFADVLGGDAFYIGGSRCSIGFSATGPADGYVSAGHCGSVGNAVQGHDQQPQGTITESRFPGTDYSFIETNPDWQVRPLVNTYPGTMDVVGNVQAPVGAELCRSGSTSGFDCEGEILQHDTCINYPEGLICGVTRTNVPAGPGDSGGSIITPAGQAQGVISGGGNGVTYYEPVNRILTELGLTLLTTGGAGGG